MKYYAEGIQKFEEQLNRPVSSFSHILMLEELSEVSADQDNRSTKGS